MKKLLLVALCVVATVGYAKTSHFTINSEVNGVEFWDLLETINPTELNTMSTTWSNQLTLKNNYNGTVNVVLSENYADSYPAPLPQTDPRLNFLLEGGSQAMTFTVTSGGVLGLRLQTSASEFNKDTACGVLGLKGENHNLVVDGTGKVYANDLQMKENDVNRKVTIKDQAYFFTRGTTQIGGANNISNLTKTSTLRLEGSQIEMAYVRNLQFVGSKDADGLLITSVDNVQGGKLEFIADANGITTLQNESAIQVFTGVIEVDFTNLKWDESWGEDHQFTLITATSGNSLLKDWVNLINIDSYDLANIKGATDGLFSADNNHLYLTITKDSLVIPEPSTYATIFGALALAFVAYRRRK